MKPTINRIMLWDEEVIKRAEEKLQNYYIFKGGVPADTVEENLRTGISRSCSGGDLVYMMMRSVHHISYAAYLPHHDPTQLNFTHEFTPL